MTSRPTERVSLIYDTAIVSLNSLQGRSRAISPRGCATLSSATVATIDENAFLDAVNFQCCTSLARTHDDELAVC